MLHYFKCIRSISYRKSLFLFLLIVLVYEAGLIAIVGIDHPLWSDESHFVRMIHSMRNDISIKRMQDYDVVQSPLTFIIYALWGCLAGFEKENLRLFSLLMAFVTYIIFHLLLYRTVKDGRVALFAPFVLLFNPYMIGLTIFVYTDLPMILCVLLTCLFVFRDNPLGLFFSAAFGILTRQYFIYITLAVALYYFLKMIKDGNKSDIVMFSASVLSFIPFGGLMVLWGGILPHSASVHWPALKISTYDLHYLTLYISLFTVYIFPLLYIKGKRLFPSKGMAFLLLLLSPVYFLIPVTSSKLALLVGGMETVGLFHRSLVLMLNSDILVHFVFFICFAVGLFAAYFIGNDFYKRLKARKYDYLLFLDVAIIMFLIVMPLSPHLWEKYFIPIIPVIMLRLLLIPPQDEARTIVE